jgi:putative phosphoesterase
MRYAGISDIHGNLEALDAVLDDISQKDIDKILCCGDIAGYGANPNECVEKIIENDVICVKGNHDAASVGEDSLLRYNSLAREALIWTRDELTDENKMFLRNNPMVHKEENILMVHGSLYHPQKFNYVFDEFEVKDLIVAGRKVSNWDICLIGHSHQPKVVKVKDKENLSLREDISYFKLADLEFGLELGDYKHVVNVGSVGQPRDGNWRSCYFIYDSDTQKLEYHRVEYELAKAQRKIMDVGLPPRLSKRLEFGR